MLLERYRKQTALPQIGKSGQEHLAKSVVTVVGCGGLGSPVLTYLACAGIGTLRLIDCDVVEESNLNRQFLHRTEAVGKEKTVSAAEILAEINPYIRLELKQEELKEENARELLTGSDVVVDCLDNLPARHVAAEACIALGIPLIEGGVSGFQGFLLVIEKPEQMLDHLGFRDPEEPAPVIGVTPGVLGCLQAAECIKWLLHLPDRLSGIMIAVDLLDMRMERIPLIS